MTLLTSDQINEVGAFAKNIIFARKGLSSDGTNKAVHLGDQGTGGAPEVVQNLLIVWGIFYSELTLCMGLTN